MRRPSLSNKVLKLRVGQLEKLLRNPKFKLRIRDSYNKLPPYIIIEAYVPKEKG